MKTLILIALSLVAIKSYSQIDPRLKHASCVDEKTREGILRKIITNKDKAELPALANKINDSTKIVRTFSSWFVIPKTDSISFNASIMKYIKVFDRPGDTVYVLYNVKSDGSYDVIGPYISENALGPRMSKIIIPQVMFFNLSSDYSFLNDASKYCNIDNVTFLNISGVEGNIVLIDDEIWIIDGYTRTDLVSYLKEHYKMVADFRRVASIHP